MAPGLLDSGAILEARMSQTENSLTSARIIEGWLPAFSDAQEKGLA
jgi:hypothetical protein